MADLFGPGFDSLQLHPIEHQKASKARKTQCLRAFCFLGDIKNTQKIA